MVGGSSSLLNLSERLAEFVLGSLIEDVVPKFQTDQSTGQHDFDLLRDGNVVGGVEVTESTNFAIRAWRGAVDKHDPFIPAVECQNGWIIHPVIGASFNDIRATVDTYLCAIEKAGLSCFFSPLDSHYPEVRRIYHDLGIEAGNVCEWKEPRRRIYVSIPGQGTLVAPENVIRSVQPILHKPDIIRKLTSIRGEPHLFVHISFDDYPGWKAASAGTPPVSGLELPIDNMTVWVMALLPEPDELLVWRYRGSDGWATYNALPVPPGIVSIG